MDPARRERLLHEFGLDRPLALQYAIYVRQVLKGDLGISLTTHEPVLDEFLTLFPATIELAFFAMVLAVCIGLPAGILAALKRNTVADYAVMGVSLTGYSMPIFWWALLLILFFSVQLGWTPVSGRIAVEFDAGVDRIDADRHLARWRDGRLPLALSHLILPSSRWAMIPLAVIAR
jgi:dipeptide transport system permease protein